MAMGNPLGSLFANIFLCHYESTWLNESPVMYKSYVDDALWLLPTGCDINKLMTSMNSCHNNMRFTCESESDNCIHFIDLNIVHKTRDMVTRPLFIGNPPLLHYA